MSLYSSGIQLLPRPPRGVFSIGSEATRATLPDFDNVTELSQFTRRLFDWHITIPHFYAGVIAGAGIGALCVLAVGLVSVRKVYESKYWLVKVIRKPTGVIIVPNPLLAFLLMIGIYGALYIPYFVLAVKQFTQHQGQPTRHILLLMTLPLLLLAYALILAVLGTFFSTPNSILSPSQERQESSPLQRYFRRADFINGIALLVPLIITVVIVTPSVIASSQWEKAAAMERVWQAEYSELPHFTQPMVQDSQRIWYQALRAAKLGSIVFALWSVFAISLSITYCCVVFNLVTAVREDIKRARETEDSNNLRTVVEQAPVAVSQIIRDTLQAIKRRSEGDKDDLASATLSGGQGTACPSLTTQTFDDGAPEVQAEQEAEEEEATTSTGQRKALEQALYQILFQALAIGPGSACYSGLTVAMSVTLHSRLEQPSAHGGNQFEVCIGAIWMALMCMSCSLGVLSFFATAYITYEPVVQRHVAPSQITYKDIAKGSTHIRSTFFDPQRTEVSPCSSPSSSDKELESKNDDGKSRSSIPGMPQIEGEEGCIWLQSWDLEAIPLGYSANATSTEFTGGSSSPRPVAVDVL